MRIAAGHLAERGPEVRQLRRSIRDARDGRGTAAVVEGPAGIGKTALLDYARAAARRAGVTTLSARGIELERDYSFGIVRQLLDPVLPPSIREQDDWPHEGGGRYADLRELTRLIERVAAREPLLMVVDDAQQSDAESLRWLAFLVRRVESLPVALLTGSNPLQPGAQTELLESLTGDRAVTVLRPHPLSREAVSALVTVRFGAHDAEFTAAAHRVTGGNPFLVHQFLREAKAATPEEAERVASARLPAVAQYLAHVLAQLPAADTAFAEALAVLGDGSALPDVAVVAGLAEPVANECADDLARAGVLSDERPPRFLHPLLGWVLLADMPAGQRVHHHARAARVLAAAGEDTERIADHLLAVEPAGEDWAADVLRRAAARALDRGSPTEAIRCLRRALDEDPPARMRNRLLFELGAASARLAAEPALDNLGRAFAAAAGPEERARTARHLAQALALADATDEAVDVLLDAIAGLGDSRPQMRVSLESDLIAVARLLPGRQRLVAETLRSVRREAAPGADAEPSALCHLAFDSALRGFTATETRRLARPALGRDGLRARDNPLAFSEGVYALIVAADHEFAAAALEHAASDAEERGSVAELAILRLLQARLAQLYRSVPVAQRLASAAVQLALSHGWRLLLPLGVAALAEADMARGDFEAAELLVAETHPPESADDATFAYDLFATRGRLRLRRGDAAGALEDLFAAGARLEALGARNPAISFWRSDAAAACRALGRHDDALRLAREEVAVAHRCATPHAVGVALRGLAAVESRERSHQLLQQSVSLLQDSPARLELARSLTALGAGARRAGQRVTAREPLRRAVDIATSCGADAVADEAREELIATGARPRRSALSGPESLTPSERRVADLAAAGASNRGIADALFITVKTVETHLGHVYGKLDVAGRRELAGALHVGSRSSGA